VKNWKILLIILSLSLLPSLLYYLCPSINYLAVLDPQHPLLFSPGNEVKNCWYHWLEHNFGGGLGLILSGRIIQSVIFCALGTVFPAKFSFFFLTFLLLAIAGWGFYLFLREFVFDKKQDKGILSVIGASFYATNLFVCINLAINIDLLFSYFLTPWVMLYSLRYLKDSKFKNLLLSALLLSLVGVCPQVPTIVIMMLIVVWTIVTLSIIEKYSLRRAFSQLAKICTASFLLSIWWILPTLVYSLNFYSDLAETLAMERFLSLISSFLNVFHLSGYWELFGVSSGHRVIYFSEALWNFRWGFILLSVLLILPFIYMQRLRERKDVILLPSLLGLLIIGYLLAQGYHDSSPIRSLYLWLIDHSVFFGTFRNNYKFVAICAFVYSISLPYLYILLRQLTGKINKQKSFRMLNRMKLSSPLPIGIILIIVASFSYPLWTRTVYNHYYQGIPKEAYEVSNFINEELKKEPGKVMILPGTWLPTYKWAFYHPVPGIFFSLIDRREAMVHRYGAEFPLSWNSKELVDSFLYKEFFAVDNQMLLNLGIKYLLLDKTLDTVIAPPTLPSGNVDLLQNYLNSRFTKIYQNGKYVLYEIDGVANSKVWIPSVVTHTEGLSTYQVVNLMPYLGIKEVAVTNISLKGTPELGTKPFPPLEVSLSNDTDGVFRYACWEWVDDRDHMDVESENGDLTIRASLHRKHSTGVLGKILDKPLDLTKYDKMIIRVYLEVPQEDIALHVLLWRWGVDSDRDFISHDRVSNLNWSGWKTFEIPIKHGQLLDEGIDLRSIDWIQIGFSNDSDEFRSLDVTFPPVIVFASDRVVPTTPKTRSESPIPAAVTDYKKINPTRYSVKVNAKEPFMLTAAFAYDPLWVAKVNGKEYQSIPLYSVLTGFWIEDTGELEITLEYKPQRWFYWGVGVSGASLIGALGCLAWGWRQRRLKDVGS
jgi:hypothetical protein